ncbi:MAG: class I SAM-dependent methyltransferase [Planctomycetota bacterium]|nr:class I SAM-dependent methyltransferase [Planctomycetota bacterium]
MPLMQEDIRKHYEEAWKKVDDSAKDDTGLAYSNPVEDAVLYPIYAQLIADLKIAVEGGSVLDVGAGSGRWVRYFLQRFNPALLMGIDFTAASVDLLKKRYENHSRVKAIFKTADLTDPKLDLGQKFDLINVMNVLFHIPEPDRFMAAMANLARHLAPGGRVVTTEYMPRQAMRTNWMMVRSRYDMAQAAAAVGLRIIDIRASCVYSNDPMGLDGPDAGIRGQFNAVRAGMNQILSLPADPQAKQFFVKFLSDVESSVLNFCKERIADVDMPSQKLVVLGM